ncbi:MAG: D-alanyl-D-alanine carboxypeptidase [Prevotella sp.]|jgi:D-alanyl-D-alanine carboxypeptidase/D-alanyl-D-alanine-endopeptidase (penicillin-binding protein 4)|nr:D-alanyl-D-alanine carboxypeptidase [Prevotella sp.]
MKPIIKLNQYAVLAFAMALVLGCKSGKDNKVKENTLQVNNIPVDKDLRSRLNEFASKPRTKGNFAFSVYDLTADKPVCGYDENKTLPVASCLKLLSGVAGLHLLGTHYMYATSLYTKGNIDNGTLHGDVAFKCGLDPQLNEPDLDMFAKQLKKKGIKKVDGKLVVDLVLTDPVKSEQHWYPWDLSFSKYGLFYKGAPRVKKALKAALQKQGINMPDSQVVLGRVPKGSMCLFRFRRPVEPVIQRMWKNSSNTQATSLLYTIGHHINPKGVPTVVGVNYLRKFLKEELKQTNKAIVVHDGCGLCIHNHLSPAVLVAVLRYGYMHQPIYRVLMRELSISGVDGTLRSEMNSPKLKGLVHGKTGTLSHPYGISSLAGYCQGGNGHLLAFSIVDSEMSVLDARVLQKRLCETLVKKSDN